METAENVSHLQLTHTQVKLNQTLYFHLKSGSSSLSPCWTTAFNYSQLLTTQVCKAGLLILTDLGSLSLLTHVSVCHRGATQTIYRTQYVVGNNNYELWGLHVLCFQQIRIGHKLKNKHCVNTQLLCGRDQEQSATQNSNLNWVDVMWSEPPACQPPFALLMVPYAWKVWTKQCMCTNAPGCMWT